MVVNSENFAFLQKDFLISRLHEKIQKNRPQQGREGWLLTSLLVNRRGLAARTIFLELKPVGRIPAVLLGYVVALFALCARQRYLRANITILACHLCLLNNLMIQK